MASEVLDGALAAVEALAATYAHPASSDSPQHRQSIARLRMLHAPHLSLANPSLATSWAGADAREGGGDGGRGGPHTGELLRRLKEGSLTLSTPLAHTEALRLYDKLQGLLPHLASAEASSLVATRRRL